MLVLTTIRLRGVILPVVSRILMIRPGRVDVERRTTIS